MTAQRLFPILASTYVETYSDVHDTTKGGRADGNGDGSTSVAGLGTTDETFCTVHGNAAHNGLAEMLSDLEHELVAIVVDVESVQNSGKSLALELDCIQVRISLAVKSPRLSIDEPSTTAPMTW